MNAPCLFDYAIIRLVPHVEREEFMNVGVILSCPKFDFLEARTAVDEDLVRSFSRDVDLEVVNMYLKMLDRICKGTDVSGDIGKMSKRERFYWLTAPRSTILQSSPVHTGLTDDPSETLEHLFLQLVRRASTQEIIE